MATYGCDYVAGPNPIDLKKEGVRFVIRYVSTPGNPKNLTLAELVALHAVGLDVAVVFETTADRVLAGAAAGDADAKSAAEQLAGLGLAGLPVYFAVDFEPQYRHWPVIKDYFAAAGKAISRDRVGVYGGYATVRTIFDADLATFGFQTYAWSGGNWDPRIHLKQVRNGVTIAGHQVDLDVAVKPYFGQSSPAPVVPAAVRRHRLRAWILQRRHDGWSWRRLKNTVQWRLWWKLGGR